MGIAGLPSTEHFLLVGLLACVAAGLATSVGALPILFLRDISERLLDGLLGFAAGVMLAATSFSLIVPALADEHGGLRVTVAGMLIGAVFLASLDKFVPHFHFLTGQMHGPVTARLKKVWLFIIAITIHNLPEGLAVGVGFGAGDIAKGMVLATAIGLQNMPEGLAVALPLRREGYTRGKCTLVCDFERPRGTDHGDRGAFGGERCGRRHLFHGGWLSPPAQCSTW